MTISLYMDVHIPQAITTQLRRRNIDVLTAQEDNTIELSDEQLLERSTALGRVLFTQDIRFRALAENWQRESKLFAGLIFGHQLGGTSRNLPP
jgi:predicted nuclease of predicted toxin-antitoxin system